MDLSLNVLNCYAFFHHQLQISVCIFSFLLVSSSLQYNIIEKSYFFKSFFLILRQFVLCVLCNMFRSILFCASTRKRAVYTRISHSVTLQRKQESVNKACAFEWKKIMWVIASCFRTAWYLPKSQLCEFLNLHSLSPVVMAQSIATVQLCSICDCIFFTSYIFFMFSRSNSLESLKP